MFCIAKIQRKSISVIKNLLWICRFTHYICKHRGPNIIWLSLPSLPNISGVVGAVGIGTINELPKVKFIPLCFLKKKKKNLVTSYSH